jgi:Glycosyl transferase family 11
MPGTVGGGMSRAEMEPSSLATILGMSDEEIGRRDAFVIDRPPERRSLQWPSWARTARLLFKAGFVPTRLAVKGASAVDPVAFVRSSRLTSAKAADVERGDIVTMSALGGRGRFGNQLFQYAFLRMYSLCNAAVLVTPPWPGEAIFNLVERRPDGKAYPLLRFFEFDDDDLVLWDLDRPPLNVDFLGYFQEIPEAWNHHRELLRTLFTMREPIRLPLQAAVDRLRRDGRTLVAIHVRRGDYASYDPVAKPWFRCVPLEWYRNLLAERWPQLENPILHVATDDLAAVGDAFAGYPALPLDDPALAETPAELRDFFLLTAADELTICNSSFSRMAALLARDGQNCFLPDLEQQRFLPYDAWSDRAFWAKFATPEATRGLRGGGHDASRRRGVYLRHAIGILGHETDERAKLLVELARDYGA